MYRLTVSLIAASLGTFSGEIAAAQDSTKVDSLVQQLWQLDRNGNGRIDPAERLLGARKLADEPVAQEGEALICGGTGYGKGGATAIESVVDAAASARTQNDRPLSRHAVGEGPSDVDAQPTDVSQQERALDTELNSYPVARIPPTTQRAPQRPAGLSRAVMYRLLANQRTNEPALQPVRQAAVFGATVGLVKREPARYRGGAGHGDCCAPSRASYVVYARR